MNKHTPGPWVRVALRGPKRWSIETNDGYPIAELCKNTADNGNADSQLIMHAPDVLAALEQLVKIVGASEWVAELEDRVPQTYRQVIERAGGEVPA